MTHVELTSIAILIGGICLGWILAQVYDKLFTVRGRKNSGWFIQQRLERERSLQDINERGWRKLARLDQEGE